ncbi:hypothetical protein [Streptomyces sp. NPDC090445]|uniref:hypothetical protein n=1 Tax=Streptomyces sp. NPDC090445 TaxID=3365963 RepID=UPI00382EC364
MEFELVPVHGGDGFDAPGAGPGLLVALEPADGDVVLDELRLDPCDVLPEGDQLAVVFAGGLDEHVEHGDDLPAEDFRGLVTRVGLVEKVIHRMGAGLLLGVEEVGTHLTCDFAVAEEHPDVQDGPAGVHGQVYAPATAASLWMTRL